MTIRLSVIAEAARKATPGKWTAQDSPNGGLLLIRGEHNDDRMRRHPQTHLQIVPAADAQHIANCDPATVQAFVEAVKALRRIRDAVKTPPFTNMSRADMREIAGEALASFDLSGMEP